MNINDLVARIDALIAKRKTSATTVSMKATGSRDTIRNWRRAARNNREAGVSTRSLTAVADVLDTNVPWLAEGLGVEDGPAHALMPIEAPLLTWVSAGQLSSDEASDEALGTARAVLPPGDWIAFRVEGESMDRISPPGSIIFVDRSDKRLVTGGFYVIDDGNGGTTYKRYQANPMRFEPVSKNKALEPFVPDNEPTIVGRVKLTTLDLM